MPHRGWLGVSSGGLGSAPPSWERYHWAQGSCWTGGLLRGPQILFRMQKRFFPGMPCDATQERNRWPFRFRVSNLSRTPRRKGLLCDNLRARREALAQIWSPGEATGPNQGGLLSFAFFLTHQALHHLQGGCRTGSVTVLGFLCF